MLIFHVRIVEAVELANNKSNRRVTIRDFWEYYTWVIFIALYYSGSYCAKSFYLDDHGDHLDQGTTVCLLAFRMTFAMLVGEIDLSIVAVAAFSPIVSILLWEAGLPAPLAMLLVLIWSCCRDF